MTDHPVERLRKLLNDDIREVVDVLDKLLDVVEAADRYANWNEGRIIPTKECPDQYTALDFLRAALAALDKSEES